MHPVPTRLTFMSYMSCQQGTRRARHISASREPPPVPSLDRPPAKSGGFVGAGGLAARAGGKRKLRRHLLASLVPYRRRVLPGLRARIDRLPGTPKPLTYQYLVTLGVDRKRSAAIVPRLRTG
jgi:hypothetical protein